MSTVHQQTAAVNAAELTAAALATLAKVADKEAGRDKLTDGHNYVADLRIVGTIDSLPVDHSIAGILSVGHPTTKASSSAPYKELLGYVLSKVNAATRDSILRDLPEIYDAGLPAVDADTATAIESTLKRLRAKTPTTVKGAVSCKYALSGGAGDECPPPTTGGPGSPTQSPRFTLVG